MDLEEVGCEAMGLDSCSSGHGPMTGSCEQQKWNFGLHKRREVYWQFEQPSAYRKGFCIMDSIEYIVTSYRLDDRVYYRKRRVGEFSSLPRPDRLSGSTQPPIPRAQGIFHRK